MNRSPWIKRLFIGIGVVAAIYGIVYADVVMRARESWLEGEKYWRWSEHPEERTAFLQQELGREQAALEKKRSVGAVAPEDYERDKRLLAFRYDMMAKESTIKYAYIWYQTAAQLFSPPESKWVRLSREKMPLAKERWKAELRAKNIPFEDYMID